MDRRLIALRIGRVCLVLLAICLAKKKPPGHPVNLNTAGAGELQLVPGIGPSAADQKGGAGE
jgi:DNA uptake protein ComE-like DNA-binding protein